MRESGGGASGAVLCVMAAVTSVLLVRAIACARKIRRDGRPGDDCEGTGTGAGAAQPAVENSRSFAKYQGLGNDFILIDNRASPELLFSPTEAMRLCDRHFSIGGDGVIFALPGENGCDYSIRIINPDGSESQMCGNGVRCLAKFLAELEGRPQRQVSYRIWSKGGVVVPHVEEDGTVTVDMGQPILRAREVPCLLPADADGRVLESPLLVAGKTFYVSAISMGNPHAVMFVDSLEQMKSLFEAVGPIVERNNNFPQRVNAEFAQVWSRTHVQMRVWERGAGATLACGTGACAVVVAGCLTGRTERRCRVTLPGGDLHIHWCEATNRVHMNGPAEVIFCGVLGSPM